jgi:hypothetical protein
MKLINCSVLSIILLGFLCLWFVGCGSNGFTMPTAPTGVTATSGNGQVTIAWTPVAGATSYNIYWSTASGVSGPVGTNGTPLYSVTNPYTQMGLSVGTPYYYVVTSVNADVESQPSAQVSATPT